MIQYQIDKLGLPASEKLAASKVVVSMEASMVAKVNN